MGIDVNVISVENLSKSFGKKLVVDDLSLQVQRGKIFGFLGPNGSGKTTSIRMMCGLLTPDSGIGHTLGYDIVKESKQIKKRVGYMTQRFGLYEDLTVRENLEFIGRVYEINNVKKSVDEVLDQIGLKERSSQLAGNLSGGWKQRVALASCMLHQPKLLLLDEPTAGVDPQARREFWEQIHALAIQGMTVLVSTHYMDEAERCHMLGYIAYGKLLSVGTPNELIQNSKLITYSLSGNINSELIMRLKQSTGVEQVTNFGNDLHVSGTSLDSLSSSILSAVDGVSVNVSLSNPQLEDVFIHLMRQH